MERHFDHDLEELKQRLLWMGSLAERAVHQAVHAVLDAEEHLAEVVLSEEDAINEMQIEIDERVQRLLATQQPMAADLRFLLAVSRINGDLERIGDQAVNIAQSATRILRHPQVKPYVDLPRMSELAEAMVRDSLNALVRTNPSRKKSGTHRRPRHQHRRRRNLFRSRPRRPPPSPGSPLAAPWHAHTARGLLRSLRESSHVSETNAIHRKLPTGRFSASKAEIS
jgi:phosphate transport system regulatory protein PhoU